MISRSQQSCAKVTRNFRHYRSGTPASVALSHCHTSFMGPLPVVIRRFSLKKQMEGTHNAVHPFCINYRLPVTLRFSSQQCPYPSITVRGQTGHSRIYPGQHRVIVKTGGSPVLLPVRQPVNPDTQLSTRHTNTSTDIGYSSSPGNKGACAIHFFARPNSTASLSISASIVFLPRRRCSSRICLLAAASSEAGTTSFA